MRTGVTRPRALVLAAGVLIVGGLFPWVVGTFAATAVPDLVITKTTTSTTIAPLSPRSFTIDVSNVGTASMPGTIAVSDTLPGSLVFLSATGTGWSCSTYNQTVGCAVSGSLAAGAALPTLTIITALAWPAAAPASIQNCAQVGTTAIFSNANVEPNLANNQSCVGLKTALPEVGTLCVAKFNDFDANGVRGAGEPYLANWAFRVRASATGQSTAIVSAATGQSCSALPVGTYTVAEVTQPGWIQTVPSPATPQSVTIAAGQTTTLTFGNFRERCCLSLVFAAGKSDNFSRADGSSAEKYPQAPVLASMPSAMSGVFDGTASDVGFSNRLVLPPGNCITSARYEIRLKPIGPGSDNDSIVLKIPGTGGATWSKGLDAISAASTPSALWGYPGAARTFVWELGSLPLGGANLLAKLNAKRILDTYVQDDASVDSIRLTVTFCDCTATLTGGGAATPK